MTSPQEQYSWDMEEDGLGARLLRKAKRHPFLAIGIVGCLGTVAVGAYRFKYRSKEYPMSLFFIQLRVAAQSMVVGSLTVGIAYDMLQRFVLNDKKEKSIDK